MAPAGKILPANNMHVVSVPKPKILVDAEMMGIDQDERALLEKRSMDANSGGSRYIFLNAAATRVGSFTRTLPSVAAPAAASLPMLAH